MTKRAVRCISCNYRGCTRLPKGVKVKYARCPGCGKVTLR